MPARTSLEQLLREMRDGVVEAPSYSRKSTYFRFEPLLRTAVLAVVAVIASVLLGTPPKSAGQSRIRS